MGKIRTMIDTRRDFRLDEDRKTFLHFITGADGALTNKNAMAYLLVEYQFGSYVIPLGFFNYELFFRRHLREALSRKGGAEELMQCMKTVPSKARRIARRVAEGQAGNALPLTLPGTIVKG